MEREWKFVAVGNYSFRIAQFNVLADGLAQTGNFTRCPDRFLEWEARWPLLKAEVEKMQPDVLCMQEVNKPESFAGLLGGHAMLYCPKLASPAQDAGATPDGCAMFINRSMFHIVRAEVFYYSNLDSDKPASAGGIVVGVKDLRNGEGLVFATTHLKAKEKPEFELIRHDQLSQLLQKVEGMKAMVSGYVNTKKVNVVLTGDFNSPPGESCYALMRERNFHSVYNSNFSKSFYDKEVVPLDDYLQGEPVFTTMKVRENMVSRTIDYIWLQCDDAKLGLGVFDGMVAADNEGEDKKPSPKVICEALYSLPSVDDVGEDGLPSAQYASDHLAIGSILAWKSEE